MKRFGSMILFFIAASTIAVVAVGAQTTARDRHVIAYASNLNVSRLESGLPKLKFSRWFRNVVGTNPRIEWEVNDCGEQTGNPHDRSSVNPPMCAQASAKLNDGRQLYVMLGVGSTKAGIYGRPVVFFISLDDHGTWKTFRTLRELAASLRTQTVDGNPTNRWTRAAIAGFA